MFAMEFFDEQIDRTFRRTRFGRGYGLCARL